MANLFNLGHTWGVKPEAQKIELEVFFRGMGGTQDCVLALAKLAKAGALPVQFVMVDGIEFADEPKLKLYGEASLGLTYYSMDTDKDLRTIKAILYDLNIDPDYAKDSWINDYDQYGKIQIRSRIDGKDWTSWAYYDYDLQAEAA
jgi:hypothetical protein